MELNKEQIKFLDQFAKGRWTLNEKTGLVDIEGDLNFSIRKKTEYCVWRRTTIVICKGLTDFKGVKFGVVTGDFSCHDNSLESLEGAPQEVGGNFYCSTNNIKSLKGAPKKVGGDFSCKCNNLKSLKGAPQWVGGNFYCYGNKLTSLVGAPQKVGGSFDCHLNSLKSLEGAPQKVGGYFRCSDNKLTSLVGAPQEVGGNFRCENNKIPEFISDRIDEIMDKCVDLRIALVLIKKEIIDKKQKEIDKINSEKQKEIDKINSEFAPFLNQVLDDDLVKVVSIASRYGHFD